MHSILSPVTPRTVLEVAGFEYFFGGKYKLKVQWSHCIIIASNPANSRWPGSVSMHRAEIGDRDGVSRHSRDAKTVARGSLKSRCFLVFVRLNINTQVLFELD